MKNIFLVVISLLMLACNQQAGNAVTAIHNTASSKNTASVYQFSVAALDGGVIHFSDFKGKNTHCKYSIKMWLHAAI